jgi:hypothetical protein
MDLERVAEIIFNTFLQYKRELENGAIISINAKNARARLLPLY